MDSKNKNIDKALNSPELRLGVHFGGFLFTHDHYDPVQTTPQKKKGCQKSNEVVYIGNSNQRERCLTVTTLDNSQVKTILFGFLRDEAVLYC